MNNNDDKTIRTDQQQLKKAKKEKTSLSSTREISRKTFMGKIPIRQYAYLEILGEDRTKVELSKEDVIIGRIPDCDLQLLVENVSRRHARLFYHYEGYCIEDLGSTNGLYVNGIKVEKCVLSDQDLLEIGGVKILFHERRTR